MKGPSGQSRVPSLGMPAHRRTPWLLVVALGLLAILVVAPGQAVRAQPGPATVPGDPLQMTITSMTPSSIPTAVDRQATGDQTSGDQDEQADPGTDEDPADPTTPAPDTLVMTGTVTNTSDETWRNIRVYPRISPTALTNADELLVALNSDARIVFGDRITDAGLFDESITSLPPGETATWRVEVPGSVLRSRISGDEGVYQVGVQALGANSAGRSSVANGRARTLIPLLGEDRPAVPAALVVPVRHQVNLTGEGAIADEEAWADELRPGGRLANLAALMATPRTLPLTWLVDPAVLDAARLLSRGNPGRTLGGSTGVATSRVDPAKHPAARYAADWLRTFTALGADRSLLALPYGDLDVAAAARLDPDLYGLARQLSTQALERLDLEGAPALSPLSGQLPNTALDLVEDVTTVFVGATALEPGATPPGPKVLLGNTPAVVHEDAVNIVNTGDEMTGTVMRQRILAEAAIRSLEGETSGMVVNLAPDFDPGADAAGFLAGLDEPYLAWQELAGLTSHPLPPRAELTYPAAEAASEISPETVDAVKQMLRWGASLGRVLSSNQVLATEMDRLALSAVSGHARTDQAASLASLEAAGAWSRRQLSRITIDTPSFVILSSDSGAFAIKIRNRLDHEVTVTVVARADDDVVIEAPEEIVLGPGATRTVTLNARAGSIGVHPVTLQVADQTGRAFSAEATVSIRSNSVGRIIWVIMGVGVGILFVAIGIRWARRLRGGRGTGRGRDDNEPDGDQHDDEPARAGEGDQ
ncbi:DUF6049 family protein [Nocardioides sp. AE5]|uniref:DUF6049 family protein n=1 Tax=Nocardioides sp. AE5 TaxID=2962573 RepID=UPI0028818EE4|nr:DUF6049 family protein [Nocardioides sp. AE5]MDT0202433.1 DUF6049 family protein [Nocardioides sp. AE5]